MPRVDETTPLLALTPAPAPAAELCPRLKRIILFISLLAGFLGALDLTIVSTCVPTISSELGAFDAEAWIGTAYLWSNVTFTPLYGRLADILGRRRAFRQALVLFTAGTFGCGLAPNFLLLCVARFIAGMGGGGMSTVSGVLVAETFGRDRRAFFQALNMCVFGAGVGLGAPIGGWLTDGWGWRAAFYVPIALVLYILVGIAVPGKLSTATRWRDIDFGGSMALLVSIGSLLLCLQRNADALNYALGLLSALAFCVFIVVEIRFARFPVLPTAFLKRRGTLCVGLISGIIAMVNFNMMYHVPMVFEIVFGQTLTQSGMHMVPNSVAMSTFPIIAGIYVVKYRRYKWAIVISTLGPLITNVLLARLGRHSCWFLQWFAVVPMGVGFTALLSLTLSALCNSVAPEEIAAAMGFMFVFRCIGQVTGVAVSGAVFQAGLKTELERRFKDASLISQLRHASSAIAKLDKGDQVLARAAYGGALHKTFVLGVVGAAVVTVISLFIPDEEVREVVREEAKPVTTATSEVTRPTQ